MEASVDLSREAGGRERRAELEDHETTFRALFDAEFDYVWNTLRRLGVAERDAIDQTQEVFVVVHGLLPDCDRSRPIRPWLFGIAYRVALRYRSLARNFRELLSDGSARETEEPTSPEPGPDANLEATEARAVLLRAIDGIELSRRAVFVMSEIDETPMSEIARVLDISLHTAHSRLRLAREDFERAVKRIRASRRDP